MKDWRTLAFTILAGVSTSALIAGVAVLWDMSGTLQKIQTNFEWVVKQGSDHETRIRALESGK